MGPNLAKLNFWSGANYMKRISDETPYTDVVVGSFGTATLEVPHTVGNIPEYDVQAELRADGRIWTGTRPYVGMNQSGTPESVSFDAWITTTKLTVRLTNPNSGSITVRVYHIIYKDYA